MEKAGEAGGAGEEGHGSTEARVHELLETAEQLWSSGERENALQLYEEAHVLCETHEFTNGTLRGMSAVGFGFALMNSGKALQSVTVFRIAITRARECASEAQAQFAESLLEKALQMSEHEMTCDDEQQQQHTVNAFVKSLVKRSAVMLIVRKQPLEGDCERLANALTRAHVRFDVYSVHNQMTVEEALEGSHGHPVPHLWVNSTAVADWSGLSVNELRSRIAHLCDVDVSSACDSLLPLVSAHDHHDEQHRLNLSCAVRRIASDCSAVAQTRELHDDEDVREWSGVTAEAQVEWETAFTSALSAYLGSFPFERDWMKRVQTLNHIVDYIELNCVSNGNCKECPSRSTCALHDEDNVTKDIEDLL